MNEENRPSGADGRSIALSALKESASQSARGTRLSDRTLERVVDIAWRHQFDPGERRAARNELREALSPEIDKRLGENE